MLSVALFAAAGVAASAATPEQGVFGVQSVARAGKAFELGAREVAVDAAAGVKGPRSLDVTVLRLHDRSVKVRFTMTGVQLPPFSTTSHPGQALVSVRVNALTAPRP